jgi:hypothetical protein
MQQGTGTTNHPGLTIRIRYVDQKGRETASFEARHVEPADGPMETSQWPPCRCRLCGGPGRS